MSKDTIDWECEICKESPYTLHQVRDKKYPWLTRYLCDKCKGKRRFA